MPRRRTASSLDRAILFATEAHAGQVDRAGEPYILHPLRVMLRMRTEEERIVAVLHDVAEDCPLWAGMVLDQARFGRVVAYSLDLLTRPRDEPYDAYLRHISTDPLARAVKLADLADNLDPARAASLPASLRVRYERAREVLEGHD